MVDLDVARRRLTELLAELDSSSGVLGRNGEASDPGELTVVDQHPADAASDLANAESDEALLGLLHDQQAQYRAALARIDAGSYGKCVSCGDALPDERLEARPEAARCVSCQHALEVR
ncbi:MAG: TraR/DksA family transcriptional regulator [Mycobacteriales bacterium]|nr:TraR/DksA family transcriptional regulator [Frankia sp.]